MKKWSWKVFICLYVELCLALTAVAQDSTKCYPDYLKILYVTSEGNKTKTSDATTSNIENLNNVKFNISRHSNLDGFFRKKLKIEAILARGTSRIHTINFSGGIESFNKENAFSEMIPFLREGDRLVLNIKGGKQCGTVYVLKSFLSTEIKKSTKTIRLYDIISEAASSPVTDRGDDILRYSGVDILPDNVNPRNLKLKPDKDGRVIIKKRIALENCNFLFGTTAALESLSFFSLSIRHSTNTNLDFSNCEFREDIVLEDCEGKNLRFIDTDFQYYFKVYDSEFEKVAMTSCSFSDSSATTEGLLANEPDIQILLSGKFKDISIDSNRMMFDHKEKSFSLEGETHSLKMEGNEMTSNLNLQNLNINNKLAVFDNHFNRNIFLYGFEIPEKTTEFYWKQLSGNKLGLVYPVKIRVNEDVEDHERIYLAVDDEDLKEELLLKRLLKTYQQLGDIYKTNGDLESANGCYSEMKDVEGRRLAHLYTTNGGFQNYFRWKLNQLMKFYTDHGTDPAKAIVISIWVIIWFGIFYFFFPSDWDATSKKKLVLNFQDFIQKNEKGYIRPFFVLLAGFLLSLLNAITLSLNSFVTLGFGNIPTHGLARYITILEGFIGWFLLSIFTVSLINQVLG